jgi:hypothetical protein
VSNEGVKIFQEDQGRFVLCAATILVLLFAVVGFSLLRRPKTAFEWAQARVEASNPKWIKVEIATADGRGQYWQNEAIFVRARFSSAMRYTYKVDVADGVSRAAASDMLHISNGRIQGRDFAITCCGTRLIGLDEQPFSPPQATSLRLAPGEYEIYLTSRRVFNWEETESLNPSSLEVASNLLKIRVLP